MEDLNHEKTILQGLMEIDRSINLKYREGKLPKFIRKMIFNNSHKKLKKTIHSYTHTHSIERSELLYFLTQVNDIYGGNYGHIKKITNGFDNTIVAAVVIPVSDGVFESQISALICMKKSYTEESILNSYSLFNEKGIVTCRFSNEFKSFLNNRRRHERLTFPWKFEDQNDCMMDLVAEKLLEDIKTFLDDMMERSERIVDEKL